MSDLVLAGGTVVTAEASFRADVAVTGERISAVGHDLPRDGAEVVDVSGALLMPGFIDGHTHLDMPFGGTVTSDDWDTGTAAALAGGTTTVVDFSLQEVGGTLAGAVSEWQGKAEGRTRIDYGLHVAITNLTEAVKEEIPSLPDLGVSTVKIFMAYKGTPLYTEDEDLFEALQIARQAGVLVMVHAENGDVIAKLQAQALARGDTAPRYHGLTRPESAEAEATGRAIRLAEIADAPILVVHVSCAPALEEVHRAHRRGRTVYAETCPQYLVFSDADLAREGFEGAKYVCSPPLRDPSNRGPLWHGLQTGDLQLFGSDHCSFNFAGQKELGRDDFTLIPNGAPGLEERAAVLWTHGVAGREAQRAGLRGRPVHQPGPHPRAGRPQGRAGPRGGRRHRRLGPGGDAHRDPGQPARAGRLHPLRGHDLRRRPGHGLPARRAGLPRRRRPGRARRRPLPGADVPSGGAGPGGALMPAGVAEVDAPRAIAGLRELARRTGTADGAQRVAWTETWAAARRVDARRAGRHRRASRSRRTRRATCGPRPRATSERFVIVGGHLDSVPDGGWLDGALNVVAGLEVLRALAGEPRALTLKLVDWADEEGARFGRSLMGSSACAGTLDPDAVRGLVDRDGVALPDALRAHGVDLDRAGEARPRGCEGAAAYLELHIEQGPVLERLGLPLGVVLGTFGVAAPRRALRRAARPRRLDADGRPPRRLPRRRAQRAGLPRGGRPPRGRAGHDRGRARGAGHRHGLQRALRAVARPARARRRRAGRHARRRAGATAGASPPRRAARSTWERIWEIEPIPFAPELIEIADGVVADLAGTSHRLPSGPLHDAAEMARVIPTVMLFVKSLRGLSHTKEEDTPVEDLELSVRALDELTRRTLDWAGRG